MSILTASTSVQSVPQQISIRRVNPLEESQWSDRLVRFPAASFFHDVPWARVLRETYGYRCDYFVAERDGATVGIVPMMEVDSWLTGRRGVGLPFTDACPPLADDEACFAALFENVRLEASSRHWKYVELRGDGGFFQPSQSATSFWGHRLELFPDEARQWAHLATSTRRALKKPEDQRIKVEVSNSLESLLAFYELLRQTRKRHGVPPQPIEFFRQIHKHVLARDHGFVALARMGDTPISGVVFFTHRDSVIYKFAASDDAYKSSNPNKLVLWQAIRYCRERGFKVMDFGRSSLSNDGLRQFKLSWGSSEQAINYIRMATKNGEYLTVPDGAVGWHNRVFRALPGRLSQCAGNFLYRHVA